MAQAASELLFEAAPLTAVDVLIVEDNEAVRTSFSEIVSSAGYSVVSAEDGVVALGVLADIEVGMILLDLKMPRLGGLAMLDMIDDPPPVVLLTASPFGILHEYQSKFMWYLQKPVDPHQLLDIVASAIGTRPLPQPAGSRLALSGL